MGPMGPDGPGPKWDPNGPGPNGAQMVRDPNGPGQNGTQMVRAQMAQDGPGPDGPRWPRPRWAKMVRPQMDQDGPGPDGPRWPGPTSAKMGPGPTWGKWFCGRMALPQGFRGHPQGEMDSKAVANPLGVPKSPQTHLGKIFSRGFPIFPGSPWARAWSPVAAPWHFYFTFRLRYGP